MPLWPPAFGADASPLAAKRNLAKIPCPLGPRGPRQCSQWLCAVRAFSVVRVMLGPSLKWRRVRLRPWGRIPAPTRRRPWGHIQAPTQLRLRPLHPIPVSDLPTAAR